MKRNRMVAASAALTVFTVTAANALRANGIAALVIVAVTCGAAIDHREYPNVEDSRNVWNNDGPDASFGVTSPIFLDNIDSKGKLIGTLAVPSDQLVTSFSSKSELAVNLASDGKSITFVGYHGGPGFLTAPNQLDVSNSNTPG